MTTDSIRKYIPHAQDLPEGLRVRGPEDVHQALVALGLPELEREVVAVIALDARNNVRRLEVPTTGTADACIVHPRDVLRVGLEANACSLVVAHNHPSGDTSPSTDDLALTRRLVGACELMGIHLHDHLIVAESGYQSLREYNPDLWR